MKPFFNNFKDALNINSFVFRRCFGVIAQTEAADDSRQPFHLADGQDTCRLFDISLDFSADFWRWRFVTADHFEHHGGHHAFPSLAEQGQSAVKIKQDVANHSKLALDAGNHDI